MITTIIFDLGGVLFTNGTKKFIQDISAKHQLDRTMVQDIMDGQIGSDYRESKISRDEFWKRALEKLQIDEPVDALEKQWIDGYELIEGTRDIIGELRKKYKLYYLSDNVRERVNAINERFHFMDWFDGGIFSHEVGVRKPNPKIYEVTVQKAGVKPEEAVFIDDKQTALDPAKKMGLSTILFTSPEDLRDSLRKLSVL